MFVDVAVKLSPLTGPASTLAVNLTHNVVLTHMMQPGNLTKTYDEFFKDIFKLPDEEKQKIVQSGLLFLKLDKDEYMPLMKFFTDNNNIPIDEKSIDNYSGYEILSMLALVCMEVLKIKVFF